MPSPKTHDDCRKCVCFGCRTKADRMLTSNQVLYVISNCFPSFDTYKGYLPIGICGTCRAIISLNGVFPTWDYFSVINELKNRTFTRTGCNCSICKIAKVVGRSSIGQRVSSPPQPPRPDPPIDFVCRKCYGTVTTTPEEHNQYCTPAAKMANLMADLSPDFKSQFCAKHLKEQVPDESGAIYLKQTVGRPLAVHMGATCKPKIEPLSVQTFMDMQSERPHLSNNDILGIASVIRVNYGRNSVESGLKQALIDLPKKLAPFYSKVKLEVIYKNKKEERWGIFCTDFAGLVNLLLKERNVQGEYTLRIGMDGGGGFFKVTLNLLKIDLKNKPPSPKSPPPKMFTFDKATAKDSGEKKLLLIGLVPHMSENPQTTKKIVDIINWEAFSERIVFTLDCKMCNIVSGQQGHGAAFNCHCCTWNHAEKGKENMQQARFKPVLQPRTIGLQNLWAQSYQNATGAWKNAQFFYSTVNKPIVTGSHDTKIMSKIPPPQLHIFTGIVNTTIADLDKHLNGFVVKWLADVPKIHQEGPFKVFAGNKCKQILNNHLQELKEIVPLNYQKYIKILEDFKLVVDACFSTYLAPNTRFLIQQFEKSFRAVYSPKEIYPKAHMLITHVADFCEEVGMGLGILSEQACEAAHYKFKVIEERYKVNDDPDGEAIYQTVLKYNVNHL